VCPHVSNLVGKVQRENIEGVNASRIMSSIPKKKKKKKKKNGKLISFLLRGGDSGFLADWGEDAGT